MRIVCDGSNANFYQTQAYGGDFLFNRNQFHFDGDIPTIMYWWLNGATQLNEQEAANCMSFFSGNDSVIDVGLNYHFKLQLTPSLHYTLRDGDPGNLERKNVNNNYFRQAGD